MLANDTPVSLKQRLQALDKKRVDSIYPKLETTSIAILNN